MATKAQLDTEIGIAQNNDFEALQAILVAQGEAVVSYDEAADIGRELLGFFEALGEENEQEDSHA